MEKKNLDWSSLGFGYIQTDKRYVSNYKNGSWDEGTLTSDATITISECAGVLQYAQTVFEGMNHREGTDRCIPPRFKRRAYGKLRKETGNAAIPTGSFCRCCKAGCKGK